MQHRLKGIHPQRPLKDGRGTARAEALALD
jgi:hypothetical protein